MAGDAGGRSVRNPAGGSRRRLRAGGSPWIGAILLILAAAGMLQGCASQHPAPLFGWNWSGPAPAGYYLIRSGDSLSLIAEREGVSLRQLAKWNRLAPPYRIYADTLLRIRPPDGSDGDASQPAVSAAEPPATVSKSAAPSRARRSGKTAATPLAEPLAQAAPTDAAAAEQLPGSRRDASKIAWEWPLNGTLVKRFRADDRTRQGIRIRGRAGESVRAAAAGTVVYSGSGLKGYGNLIIVKHDDKYLSAYGFNRRLLVAEGAGVRRGQALAEVGRGPDGSYLLHFEVRVNGTAVDPILYLPARGAGGASGG